MSDRTPDQNTRGSQGAETAQDEPQDQQAVPAFAELGIDGRVLAALEGIGYEKPSPIQAATIPVLLEGRDVVGMAQTGTGKTAAFAIPALSRLAELADLNGPTAATQVLVLAPTRELALQVGEAFASYAAQLEDFTVLPVYGGSSYGPQLAGLRRGAQVVVGTPGRVIDHLKRGSLTLQDLQYLVLDEADEMLRMGFAEDVETILSQTPEEKQVALFSATMPPAIRKIAQKYLRSPEEISVKAKTSTATNIRQRYLQVMGAHKLEAMTRLLEVEEHDGIIVFVRTKAATEEVAEKLRARGHAAAAINGDIPQQAREKSVEQLRSGKIDILVATDVAARGLDVERISLVVNYDIPHDTESYVHRIGRTGRAGRSGEAILFITPREQRLLGSIERATKQKVEPLTLPSVEELTNTRVEKFTKRIDDALATTELSELATVIEQYELSRNVPATDIAAALAALLLESNSLKAEPMPEPTRGKQGRDRDRDGKPGRERGARSREGMVTYRLAVGRNERVQPGSIVGAIANEGGITSKQIGHIDIRSNHTLVDLPQDLDPGVLKKLAHTEIQGRPIDIRPDSGRPGRPFKKRNFDKQPGDNRNFRGDRRGGGKKFGGRDRDRSRDRY